MNRNTDDHKNTNDTQGHGMKPRGIDEADTQGHVIKAGRVDEADTEGHAVKGRP